ncbi:hypothetical protein MNEG_5987 [Monoraphidium neglectum]|uniref:Helicase ATP-binding domain-containing protein n=1 Tax=Monoraphidium neglectum TaxID=145388 RepID=A0A0D2MN33_9CHLO|nr:hypothetical protein MNEG_5987 [Monoraphidium neglectum]KIZ01977.1 hypothetical protein MNEG_5987 [Monoraphidium neglectum]|eukprot:XP_013900996.1 hypothetical protein MNEG_5987 [Monoraphidium neglectum]
MVTVRYSASLKLDANQRIKVELSGPHDSIKETFAPIQGALELPSKGWRPVWSFPMERLREVEAAMKGMQGLALNVDPLPQVVHKVLTTAARQPDDSARYDRLQEVVLGPDETLDDRMMPFQREGVKFGLARGGRVLVGDEMGLGKTVQACALLWCYRDEWPALIVAPSSLRRAGEGGPVGESEALTWAAALYDWLRVTEDRVACILTGADVKRSLARQFDALIISYDLFAKCADELTAARKFKVVVLDEAHLIKNTKAKRTKAALPVLHAARRTILLTGTPTLSRPAELLPQLQGLLPGARISKREYAERYCEPTKWDDMAGSKNTDELHHLVGRIMVRRKKNEVLQQLPPKRRHKGRWAWGGLAV